MSINDPVVPGDPHFTPNVSIENPDTRRKLTTALSYTSLITAAAALFFMFFPEVMFGSDIPTRAIGFVNALVSMLTGAFSLTVLRPNIPKP